MDESTDPSDREPAAPDRLTPSDADDDGLNWRLVVGVLATAAVIGYLVVDGLGSKTYFFGVAEAIEKQKEFVGHQVRVKGDVVEGSVRKYDERVGRTFAIEEKGEKLRVRYERALPDTFDEGVTVVATGTLTEAGHIDAERVLVKCPSRYGDEPPTAEKSNGPSANR